LIFMALSSWQGFALLAGGRQRVTLAYDAVGLLVNATLNIWLIRWLGYLGAALAVLATSGFVALCAGLAAHRLLHVRMTASMLASLFTANSGLAAVMWLTTSLGMVWWMAVALGAASYPLLLLLCRVTTTSELKLVLARRPAASEAVA
jgi:O-antigen/teichoic acid export membrane protein